MNAWLIDEYFEPLHNLGKNLNTLCFLNPGTLLHILPEIRITEFYDHITKLITLIELHKFNCMLTFQLFHNLHLHLETIAKIFLHQFRHVSLFDGDFDAGGFVLRQVDFAVTSLT